jgi:hypothetical protein
MTSQRTCAGCGHKFRAFGDERYCTATCAGGPAQATLLQWLWQDSRPGR